MQKTYTILIFFLSFTGTNGMNVTLFTYSISSTLNRSHRMFFFDIFPTYIETTAPTSLKYNVSNYSDCNLDTNDPDTQTIINTIIIVKKALCINKEIYTRLFSSYKIYLRKIIDRSCYDTEKFKNNMNISEKCGILFGKKIIKSFENNLWKNIIEKKKRTFSDMIVCELCTFSMANWYIDINEKIVAVDQNITDPHLLHVLNTADKNLLLIFIKILAFMPKEFMLVMNYDSPFLYNENPQKFASHGLTIKQNERYLWTSNATRKPLAVLEITHSKYS